MTTGMAIKVTKTTMVKPAAATPRHVLRTSILDQMVPRYIHVPTVYFYRPAPPPPVSPTAMVDDFFDSAILKEALRKVLIPFYPVAGRLMASSSESGRIDINCNGEGALFVEAQTSSVVDDFGDFVPSPKLRTLVPTVDYSAGLSSYPLLLVQVTYFKCGGVSIGVAMDHHVVDGFSALHFFNTWSDMARGIDIKTPPFIDRTILCARNPPKPVFDHIEYKLPSLTMKTTTTTTITTQTSTKSIDVAIYKLSNEQLKTLKAKCGNTKNGTKLSYSTFEILAGHVWKCACKARKLGHDQETKLHIVVDGRFRFQPPLPPGYLGNVIFSTTPIVKVEELVHSKLWYAANQIQSTLRETDDSYLRSAIDYLELQPDISVLSRGPHTFGSPNLGIVSWVRLPFYDADFGWGRPIFVGPAAILFDGLVYLMNNPNDDDGSLSVAIGLQHEHMKEFEKLLYDM
ncbi:shikimate O-hydroxycinnamoyltransferase-like [Humulus lupulus]|uniref:shikimate O-hydroxycinnamoyltransferase-like n=1 Tax=Humulus lupulus TaxID=3486 RepID=UPI002B40FF35|nr:shikimate O-hydroxycinnamoyltransferase-like [Humulus lupulus]